MENKILHSITAVFNTPDEIIGASKAIVKEGYSKFDVHTPYPVHGLDKAMKLKRSPLGYFAFVLGVTGACLALMLMWWTMTVAYPMNISGKPEFPLPAFIPITFEVTVLLASIATVVSMIVIFFKFPNTSHPLHDTDYMRKVSSDKYGITIESNDPKFEINTVKEFLAKIGGNEIEEIYFDNDEVNAKPTVLEPRFITGLAVISIIVIATTYFVLNKLLFIEPFNWMMNQQKITAMKETTFFDDGFSMRPPVTGTVARGFKPFIYADSIELAEKLMINPLEINTKNLENGKRKYNTYCSPCHDYHGTGQARLNGQYPNPPSLHTDKVREWGDGRIYHIITMGQNTMPSYDKQLTESEKWQIILYVRALQRALNAQEGDL